jgi:hypothetical protein
MDTDDYQQGVDRMCNTEMMCISFFIMCTACAAIGLPLKAILSVSLFGIALVMHGIAICNLPLSLPLHFAAWAVSILAIVIITPEIAESICERVRYPELNMPYLHQFTPLRINIIWARLVLSVLAAISLIFAYVIYSSSPAGPPAKP